MPDFAVSKTNIAHIVVGNKIACHNYPVMENYTFYKDTMPEGATLCENCGLSGFWENMKGNAPSARKEYLLEEKDHRTNLKSRKVL
jgi:hypothetical protein